MRKNILMLVLIGSCISVTASVTNRWTNQEANTTPDTAINFSDAGNWSDGVIQDGSDVFFRFENFEPNQKRYVKLTTPIYLSHLYSRNKNIFIGEKFIFKGEDKNLRPGISLANSSNPPYLYNGIELTTFAPNMGPWFGAAYFACNIHIENSTVDLVFSSGTPTFREDWFAEHSNETRSGLVKMDVSRNIKVTTGSANLHIYAPRGCVVHDIICTQNSGSPWLKVDEKTKNHLAVGTIITGEGIPEGTFLKRVFPDNAYIELSQNVTSSI